MHNDLQVMTFIHRWLSRYQCCRALSVKMALLIHFLIRGVCTQI